MADQPINTTATHQRLVRVFISSTFRDMQEERDLLVKRIFPELRRRCRDRGLEFVEVDLRWGVTEEQTQRGEVLPVCFAEIDNCSYFISLLGERYGWVPDGIAEDLIESYPWLVQHRDCSLTELEIVHALLNKPQMAPCAFLYFRSRDFIDTVPIERRRDFVLDDSESVEKLRRLKERIRNSGLTVRENYPSPEACGNLILNDLWQAIDQVYPSRSEPDPPDRETADHAAFIESRAKVYIGRQEYFDRLDRHVDSKDPPLVVLGESGMGKSALVATWVRRYRDARPDDFVLVHFIGSTQQSADYTAILRRIMGEIKRRCGLSNEVPNTPEKLREEFPNWLSMAAVKSRLVLILDALNQIEDRDNAPDLVWLPEFLPPEVRVILCTLPGRSLDALNKRGWPTFTVEGLRTDERKQVIREYLLQYRKRLSEERINRIAAAEQTANPLYLRALLDELRLFGVHEELDSRITHYLEAPTVPDLYEKILARWEQDYEGKSDLVGNALSLLWAARRGLSEAELLDLLGSAGQPLPRAMWSPFYLAVQESLVSRSGLLGFFHDYLREAVRETYLPTESHEMGAHQRLAGYFERQPLNSRKVEELPWQLVQATEWKRLYELLADLTFFSAAWGANQFEVKAYWAWVERGSPLRMADAYRPVLGALTGDTSHVWRVAKLFHETGHLAEALPLWQSLGERFRQTGDRANLQAVLGNRALILHAWGESDAAMALHREEERLCRELELKVDLAISLGAQATILKARGELDASMALLKEKEQLCREAGHKAELGGALGSQGIILYTRGDLDGAMALQKEKERLCRELGEKDGLSQAIGEQAFILRDRGDFDGAMALLKEEERLCRELGDKNGLVSALNSQGTILQTRGDLDGAMALFREVKRLSSELGDKYKLQAALGNEAGVLWARGELDAATALFEEQEQLCRVLGEKDGLAHPLRAQAGIFETRGDLHAAIALLKQARRLWREIGNKHKLARSLYYLAFIRIVKLSRHARALLRRLRGDPPDPR